MRPIDADELKRKECSECQFHTEECPMDCGVMERIDSMPTVEAIHIERVAEMLDKYAGLPCTYTRIDESTFCKEYCNADELRSSKLASCVERGVVG